MRIRHFQALRPVCPVCQTGSGQPNHLEIAQVIREDDGHIIEGVLHCSQAGCQREYPIIDGIPLIIRDIRAYLSENVFPVCSRTDLSETMESILGDCCGAGSAFDVTRQQLSSYAWDHYADLDPREPSGDPQPGSVLRVLEHGLNLAGQPSPGPIIDVGCSVGRTSFALAEWSDDLVLGVDLNYAMLRLAADVLRIGRVRYPRRRVGLVYERREFPTSFENTENVDFWACDATALPLAAGSFSTAVSLNTLDCVHSPMDLLSSLAHAVRDGCPAVIACPYDWSISATPLEGWLGGHSQRSPDKGASEPVLRRLLTDGHPHAIQGLRIVSEADGLDWHVRMHERSVVSYKAHLVVAEGVTTPE